MTILLQTTQRAGAQSVVTDAALATLLQKKDEVLLKAAHTADRGAWTNLAAPDFFYLDEEGGVTYLDPFLKQLQPMSSPPLQIQSYKLTRAGNTAVVLHEDADQHQVRYIFTETWQRLNGQWRLRVLHITNVLSDPPAITLSNAQIKELEGSYSSGSRTYTLHHEFGRILAKLDDGTGVEWKAETRDVLFGPEDPRERMIFLRDAEGKVTGFVVRYESSDTLWSKQP